MKLSIIVFLTVLQHVSFAAATFKAATVATQVFAPQQVFKKGLFNSLPAVQREALLSLLASRPVFSNEVSLQSRQQFLLPVEKKAYLIKRMATRRGYKQLLEDRQLSSDKPVSARNVFSLENIWKVNLQEVMPQTAALTDEHFTASPNVFMEIDPSTLAVLDLVAMGHEDIIETFKNLDYQQSKSILMRALQSWHHKDGEESLVQKFSARLTSDSKFLQGRLDWLAEAQTKANSPHHASIITPAFAKEVAEMEKIASLEVLAGKAEAIATFYAERAAASYDYDRYIEQQGSDRVVAASIDDLGADGHRTLFLVSLLAYSHENIFEFIAQETANFAAKKD